MLLGLALALARLLREGQLLDILQAHSMHIDDAFGQRGVPCTALGEAHLARINEVPALILVVVLGLEPLLAEVAEVVGGDVRLGAVVRHDVLLEGALTTACLTYITY